MRSLVLAAALALLAPGLAEAAPRSAEPAPVEPLPPLAAQWTATIVHPPAVSFDVVAGVPSGPVVLRLAMPLESASFTRTAEGDHVYTVENFSARWTVLDPAVAPLVVVERGEGRAAPAGSAPPAAPERAPATAPATAFAPLAERAPGFARLLRALLDALFALLRAGGVLVALYSRIRPSRALDHPMRARLHAAVVEAPGLHVAALAEALEANPKTLAHHLLVLRRVGLVRFERDGRLLRVRPVASPAGEAPEASATRRRALEEVRAGAATRAELASRLGVTPQAVSYHLKELQRQGRVRVRWLGRERRFEAV